MTCKCKTTNLSAITVLKILFCTKKSFDITLQKILFALNTDDSFTRDKEELARSSHRHLSQLNTSEHTLLLSTLDRSICLICSPQNSNSQIIFLTWIMNIM